MKSTRGRRRAMKRSHHASHWRILIAPTLEAPCSCKEVKISLEFKMTGIRSLMTSKMMRMRKRKRRKRIKKQTLMSTNLITRNRKRKLKQKNLLQNQIDLLK